MLTAICSIRSSNSVWLNKKISFNGPRLIGHGLLSSSVIICKMLSPLISSCHNSTRNVRSSKVTNLSVWPCTMSASLEMTRYATLLVGLNRSTALFSIVFTKPLKRVGIWRPVQVTSMNEFCTKRMRHRALTQRIATYGSHQTDNLFR